METHLSELAMATAQAGQTITKNTSVSILLVVMLVGATFTVTNIFNNMSNDIDNLKEDMNEIKELIQNQSIIPKI